MVETGAFSGGGFHDLFSTQTICVMRNRALIILLILVAAAAAWLIYANWGKLKRKTGVSPLPLPATDNASGQVTGVLEEGTGTIQVDSLVDTPAVPHLGWYVPPGINGDKLQEDMILQVGSIGEEVVMLQSVLNISATYLNVAPIKLDGYFGPGTLGLLKKLTGLSKTTLNNIYTVCGARVWGH